MRREPVGARGIDERRRRGSGQLGLRFPGDVRQDESQRERVVPRPADAREEQIGIVAACAKQQRYQSQGEMLRDVTERNVRARIKGRGRSCIVYEDEDEKEAGGRSLFRRRNSIVRFFNPKTWRRPR